MGNSIMNVASFLKRGCAVGIAGRMAGPDGKPAAKMVAVGAAGVIRDN